MNLFPFAFALLYATGLWRLPIAIAVVASVVWVQRFWFYETRRWVNIQQPRGRRTYLHAVCFFLLIGAMVVTAATSTYHAGIFHWWADAILAIYFVGSFLSGYCLMLFRGLLRLAAGRHRAPTVAAAHSGRRQFVAGASATIVAAPIAASIYGLARERLDFETRHAALQLGPKGQPLRGRTMAQLSDIHISPYLTAADLRRIVDHVNSLAPDLVLLTGDFVTFRGDSQYDCVRELSRLRPKTGVYGCLGNHEIYTNTEDSITRLFATDGFEILRYEGRRVALGGGVVNIAGIDFFHDSRPFDLEGLRKFYRAGEPNLLLTHNPNAFDFVQDLPVDVCISGHTHGGQLRLEFIHADVTPAKLMTNYVAGMYESNGKQLYVNRGLGTIGVPIRLGARPEITLFQFT